MAVYLDESNFFKFVIISDNPKPSKNNFTEKPPKDREQKDNNMSTGSSSPPPNNEKLLDEKKQNSQESTKLPEVKVDDIPNNNGDSTKEQKNENEEKSSRLTIKVPLKNASPQIVTSPSEIRAKTPEPTSPIPSPNSSIFKNVSKKLGNFMKSSENGTTPDQEVTTVTTSDSKDQLQQVQEVQQVPQVQEVVNNIVANDIKKDIVNTARSIDENKKEDEVKKNTPEPTGAKQRTASLPNLVNMFTRTSSLLVDKLKKEFDNLDRRMYPDMEPEWVEENQNKSNKSNKSSRDAAISEREQLLGNKDVEITNGGSQKPQSTQNIMSEIGDALNERQEKLDNLGEKTEELSNHATDFAELAAQIRKNQEQKSKWFW